MPQYDYTPLDVTVMVGVGAPTTPVKGFAAGTMISVATGTDAAKYYKGTQGEGTHVDIPGQDKVVTLRLQHTSKTNAILQGFADSKILFAMIATDISTMGDVFTSGDCKIRKIPDWMRGDDVTENEWIIQAGVAPIKHTGNKSI